MEDLNEKCGKVKRLPSICINIPLAPKLKHSFFNYITNYIKICDHLKEAYTAALSKTKRSAFDENEVTPEFSKLYTFKNYILELKMDDF